MKRIRWWTHAPERLIDRGIDEKLILDVLKQADQVILSGRQKIIHKRYYDSHRRKEYLLRIFTEGHTEEWIIRSVYRTSKIAKY